MTTFANLERHTQDRVSVLPVQHGDRPIGAYLVHGETATFCPAVDVTRLATTALATVAVIAVAGSAAAALRGRSAIGTVTMGPGGWISLKGTGTPPLRPAQRRPWWARLLWARRLVVQR